jgi:hypothetical protein
MRSSIRHGLALALPLAAMVGCGGPRMRTGELYAGRVGAAPSLRCLPDPDVVDAELSPRMRTALELADESFAVQAPPPPTSRSALDLTDWAEGPLRDWLGRKTQAIEEARHELDAAAEESHRQRIMGGAVVGLMYEDVARVLRAVPAPEDLEDEPEILEIYQQVLESQARPFLETARRAYHACALNASEPESMRHWSRFCRGREDALPEADGPQEDGTTVEVLVD